MVNRIFKGIRIKIELFALREFRVVVTCKSQQLLNRTFKHTQLIALYRRLPGLRVIN